MRNGFIGGTLVVLFVLAVALIGCSGSSGSLTRTAPTAAFTITPTTGTTATSFTVDASGSSDSTDPLGILEVRWDWNSSGVWTAYTTAKTATHTYTTAGTYTIALQVKNSAGLTSTITHAVTVTAAGGGNTAPTASFTISPGAGDTTTNFTVDASGSSDAQDAASALQVRWDWESNGTWTAYTTTKTATHIFATTGTRTITLQVKDTGGLTTTTTRTVTVSAGNTAPTASFTITPASGTTATNFAVDASASADGQDAASALQVRWDWENNGTWTAYTTTKTATHTFAATGVHTVAMQVKDTGGLTATITHTVSVTAVNTAPTASFTVTPSTGTTSTSFAVDASGSTDVQDATSALQVRWDWENTGTWTSYATSKTTSHTFATAGTKTIVLEVKDSGGLTATTTRSVTVTAPAGPSLTLSLDASLNGSSTAKITEITSAELLTTAGITARTATISGGAAAFSLSGLSTGTYFIRVNNLADDLVPCYIASTASNINQFVGRGLDQSVIGTIASPTYRFKTFSKGQGYTPVSKYSNGTSATPERYGYAMLTFSTQTMESRVLGTGALLTSHRNNNHSFSTWLVGSNNHGIRYNNGSNCSGCHGNLDSHPANAGNIGESNGWCFKCHYGKTGSGRGLVDPTQ